MGVRSPGLPGNLPPTVQNTANNMRLFELKGADLQVSGDQAFTQLFTGTNYVVSEILAVRKTGAASALTAGGIYTAAAKGGSAIVAAAQSWAGLSGAGKFLRATLAALLGTDAMSAVPKLNLTTVSTTPCTVDIYIHGYVVD